MDHNTLVDIFFTITAAAVIIIALLLAVGLIYIISVFRTMRRVVRTAEFAAQMIGEDLSDLRQNIKTRGLSFAALAKFFASLGRRRILSKRKK